MTHLLIVALGGAIGAMLRHLVSLYFIKNSSSGFPWATLTVNIAGSFAMGLLVGWLAKKSGGSTQEIRLFLATGILGGFTTFSAFSLDFAQLWGRGETTTAFTYVASSVVISLMAIFAGLWFARAV